MMCRTVSSFVFVFYATCFFVGCSSPDAAGTPDGTDIPDVGENTDTQDIALPTPDVMGEDTTADIPFWEDTAAPDSMVDGTSEDVAADLVTEDIEVPQTDTTPPEEDALPSPDSSSPESDVEEAQDTTPEPEDTFVEEEDTTPEPEDTGGSAWLMECPGQVTITTPTPDAFFYIGDPISLQATVDMDIANLPEGAQIQWEDASGWVLHTSEIEDIGGIATSNGSYLATVVDDFPIHARLITAEGACVDTVNVLIHTCGEHVSESFDGGLGAGWIALDSASWQNTAGGDGWVELTGNIQGARGAIYNQDVTVDAGSASVQITFATGGGINSGADGLAMTVVDLDTLDDLLNMIDVAHSGGGLGYGVAGAYGPWVGDALHVEVDTWYNIFNGTTEFHTDPTPENHVAIALNGDPGNAIWWEAIPTIEDLNWHTIQIDIIDSTFKVFFDGQWMITQQVADLEFRGGYIYFSASTGWATNFHKIGHLDVIHSCK